MFDVGVWDIDTEGNVQETSAGDELHGMHKLVQRLCVALLQDSGSVKYTFGKDYKCGCNFMQVLRSGEMRSEMDVSAQFFLARHFIFANMRSEELPDDPPDECFHDVRCKGIAVTSGLLKLKLKIQSKTAAITVWLPIAMPK